MLGSSISLSTAGGFRNVSVRSRGYVAAETHARPVRVPTPSRSCIAREADLRSTGGRCAPVRPPCWRSRSGGVKLVRATAGVADAESSDSEPENSISWFAGPYGPMLRLISRVCLFLSGLTMRMAASLKGKQEWVKWVAAGAAAVLMALAAVWGATGHTPASLVQMFFRYGFAASFTLVFVSEIGDKTFFMAGICAMRVGRLKAFLGAALALAAMTAISVLIGVIFKQVPDAFTTSLPVAEYIAVALLVYFGVRSIKDAWALPDQNSGEEFEEATEAVDQAEKEGKVGSTWKSVLEVASLVFAAEWGDRSMLAVIALAAGGTNALCVGIGALSGHFAATLIAVMGGALIGKHVSDKMIGYSGGILFLVFAALTVLGVC